MGFLVSVMHGQYLMDVVDGHHTYWALRILALDQCTVMAIYRLPLPADRGGPILHHLWSMTRSVPAWDTSRVFATHVCAPTRHT